MMIFKIAAASAWFRRGSLLLTVFSIAISTALLLGIDKISEEGKSRFISTISKTDLIVGARSGPVNLLLYSVFRIGNATNNVSWETYEEISQYDEVAWTIPISLGDSHRGFRVMGTTADYFEHYRYGNGQNLALEQGEPFENVYDAVLGAEAAEALGYNLGDPLIIAHGLVSAGFAEHDDKPFEVVGILARTGTPIDHTVHVSLAGIEAIHIDWQSGSRSPFQISAEEAAAMELKPQTLTAFMIGLNNRIDTFRLQRQITEYDEEPLLAIIPGATLAELWQTLAVFEQVLFAISIFALLACLSGMLTTLLSTLNERRREMAVLRATGAHPYQIVLLLVIEAFFILLVGCLSGIFLLYLIVWAAHPFLLEEYGLQVTMSPPSLEQWRLIAIIIALGIIISLIPSSIAYRRSLQDGLAIKI
ncbi:MAG: ABC transporter permease [Anaerolineae bacterium]